MPEINVNNLVKVGQLQTALTRVKTELTNLDGQNFSSVAIADGQIKFYASTDCSGDVLKSVDLPEELFLDQVRTTFVQSFAWSNATYPGSTNPNLEGKPVLVLAVKGDKSTNPTLTYSFINMQGLVDTYTAADNSIDITSNAIGVKISAGTGNQLSLQNDGLFVGHDSTKVDTVNGKQLSTEDYTTAEKTKLSGIETGAQANVIESVKVNGTALSISGKAVDIDLSGKVDVVSGKQLSTEDYTTAEKTKLAGIDAGANVNVIESVKVNGTALTVTGKAVDIDLSGKVDTVAGAANNLVVFGANGAIADGGLSISAIDARNKVDKVTGVQNNFVVFGASGAIADAGFGVASDSDINTMLTNIFGA